ncbi:MAG: hypothetical protein AAB784_03180 [Patescibacteria group bacterium]
MAAIVTGGFLLFFWMIPYRVGQFYESLDNYSGQVSRGDQVASREGLTELKYFYDLNSKLKIVWLDWVAHKYIFSDAVYYDAAYQYMTGRYDKILEGSLKEDDGFWASFLKGNSRWRIAQGVYAQGASLSGADSEKIKKQADEMAASTKDDYERAIRKDVNSIFSVKWNYDQVTDPSARAAGLAPKPAKVKLVLGRGSKKGDGKGKDDGKGKGGKPLKEGLDVEGEEEGRPRHTPRRPG